MNNRLIGVFCVIGASVLVVSSCVKEEGFRRTAVDLLDSFSDLNPIEETLSLIFGFRISHLSVLIDLDRLKIEGLLGAF